MRFRKEPPHAAFTPRVAVPFSLQGSTQIFIIEELAIGACTHSFAKP